MSDASLPDNWATARLGDLITFAIGGDWGKAPGHEGDDYTEVLCIRASEVRNWRTEKGSTAALRLIKKTSLETRQLRKGDILVEVSGGGPEQPVGRTLLVDDACLAINPSVPKVCTNFFRLIRPSSEILPSYLSAFLEHFYSSKDMNHYQGGSNNLRNLKFDKYLAIEVPVPPRSIQESIVAKIDELFSELAKGVESLTIAREQLKAYRQSVLKHAFEGRLTSNLRSRNSPWPEHHLGELIKFLTSGSRGWADYYADHGDLFIRAQNLKHDRLDLSDAAFVSLPKGKTEGLRTRVQLGDVLITITGANVTKTGLVDRVLGEAYVSQHVALCRLTERLLPEFLYWYLLSESGGRRQLNEAAYGAGKPGLNLDNIRSVAIPVPTIAEQKAVVSLIVTSLESEGHLRGEIAAARDRTDALRHAILKQAFSGQLVTQNAHDEPASVLLERIRAEQSNGGAKRARNSKNNKKEAA